MNWPPLTWSCSGAVTSSTSPSEWQFQPIPTVHARSPGDGDATRGSLAAAETPDTDGPYHGRPGQSGWRSALSLSVSNLPLWKMLGWLPMRAVLVLFSGGWFALGGAHDAECWCGAARASGLFCALLSRLCLNRFCSFTTSFVVAVKDSFILCTYFCFWSQGN